MAQAVDKKTTKEVNKSDDAKASLMVLWQMAFCAAGVYGCMFYWSNLQERIGTEPYLIDGKEKRFDAPIVIGAMQSFCAALLGAVTCLPSIRGLLRTAPKVQMLLIALGVVCCAPLAFFVMRRISFVFMMTLKMCKMVPILLVGMLWHRRKYPVLRVVEVILVTAGVVSFALISEGGKDKKGAVTSLFGIALVCINLVLDGYVNSSQDDVVHRFHVSGPQLMFLTHFFGLFWYVVYFTLTEVVARDVLVAPELTQAVAFFTAQPLALRDVVLMVTFGAVGQFFIFRAIALFGSLTLQAITATRKIGTVLISVALHGHSLSALQWTCLCAVFAGVGVDATANIQAKKSKSKEKDGKKE